MTARPILITSCLLTLLLPLSAKATGWEKLPPLPEPNGGFICGAVSDQVYVAGGTLWRGETKIWLSTVWRLNVAAMEWEPLYTLPQPVAYGVAGTRQLPTEKPPCLFFTGGFSGTVQRELMTALDGKGIKHVAISNMPHTMSLSAGGIVKNHMVFSGGSDDPGKPSHFSNSTWKINLDTHEVTRLPNYPAGPFGCAASTIALGRLHVFGGGKWDPQSEAVVNINEAHAFSMKDNQWHALKPLPFAVRGMSAVWFYDHIYLAGGYKSDAEGFTDEAFLYNIQKDEYRPAKPLPYKAMAGLVVCDGYVYCLGGEDKQKSRTDACFRIPIKDLLNK
ncbi:kelch repeat-containing protein [Prosthecobacter sp. SYSU 5D2]|uniref:Kelch repeat-containing protein n=1 Tax=Prosthecobacter sp. SYSU 5D2 TaxID=3134134 RepID=UPI0031FEAA73